MADGAQQPATKLGFSLSKAASRPKPQAPQAAATNGGGAPPADVEFVFAIDDGQLASDEPRKERPLLVIPALPNTFESGTGNKRPRGVPSFIPEASADVQGGERFEKAIANEQAQAPNVQYGLNKRSRSVNAAAGDEQAQPTERSFVERALDERNAAETAQLRDDLARLPDSAALDAYDSMPVECFGEAMLRGMGWTDGAPVGRNAAAVVKPIEYVPRPQLLGLGATLAALPGAGEPGSRKAGGKAQIEHKMLPIGPDGRVRNVRDLDEQLVSRTVAGPVVGKRMVITGAPHAGLSGDVLAITPGASGAATAPGDRKVTVRLDISGERVTVRASDLAEVGSQEAERAEAQHKQPGGMLGSKGPGHRGNGATNGGAAAQQQHRDRSDVPAVAADTSRPWLTPRVRVRVVSQRLNGGAHYLKKGVIIDVVTPTECTIQLDDGGKLVDNVPQRALETVLPKAKGAPLCVVAGRFRGQHATLVGKDTGAGNAHVCLELDLSVVTVSLDEVAEFVP